VSDIGATLAALGAADCAAGWRCWAVGKTEEAQRMANRLSVRAVRGG
jgi:hypothetical protein